jgi:hypothetical protein
MVFVSVPGKRGAYMGFAMLKSQSLALTQRRFDPHRPSQHPIRLIP